MTVQNADRAINCSGHPSSGQVAIIAAEVNGLDQSLIPEVVERPVVDIELGNDRKAPAGGQCSAVLAVQFVDAMTIGPSSRSLPRGRSKSCRPSRES